jgi:hypothetical protein
MKKSVETLATAQDKLYKDAIKAWQGGEGEEPDWCDYSDKLRDEYGIDMIIMEMLYGDDRKVMEAFLKSHNVDTNDYYMPSHNNLTEDDYGTIYLRKKLDNTD